MLLNYALVPVHKMLVYELGNRQLDSVTEAMEQLSKW